MYEPEVGRHENSRRTEMTPPGPSQGDYVTDTEEPTQLRNTLTNLYRRARSDYEERGSRILHVALGTLHWRETPEANVSLAPLVLLPVDLTRQSPGARFALRGCDEDAVLNPCLVAKMENEFRTTLPNLPDDLEDFHIEEYLGQLASLVDHYSWSVTHDVWLGLFSFHKLAMYKDLQQNESTIMASPIVRLLAGVSVDLPDPKTPAEDELDMIPPEATHLILEADSSQLRAIEAVKTGRSLVLQGPPGTGKSQTIANLIGECIALGKKVLFVSEKMAALEVVHKRLAARHLRNYILELHSHNTNKRAIVAEIDRARRERLVARQVMTDLEFAQLKTARDELNSYVGTLHRRLYPLGRSPYQVLGRLATLKNVTSVPFQLADEALLGPESLAHVLRLAERMVPVWHIAHQGPSFPWRGNTDGAYTAGAAEDYRAKLAVVHARSPILLEAIGALLECLRLSLIPSPDTSRFLASLEPLLRTNARPHPDWVLESPVTVGQGDFSYAHLLKSLSDWHASTRKDAPWVAEAARARELAKTLGEFSLDRLAALDLDGMYKRYQGRYGSIFRFFMTDYYCDQRALKDCCNQTALPPNVVQFLGAVLELLTLLRRVKEALSWASRVKSLFASFGATPSLGFALLVADGCFPEAEYARFQKEGAAFNLAWQHLTSRFGPGHPRCQGLAADATDLREIASLAGSMAERVEELRDWIDYRDTASEWERTPRGPVLRLLESAPPASEELVRAVERTLLQAWWDRIILDRQPLVSFRALEHENLIRRFGILDTQLWQKGHERVVSCAQPRMPDPLIVYPGSESSVLASEVAKKRRHLPIRRLFEKIPNFLQQVKPVMLMSPLSVSQYLSSPHIRFDVVIFDEASQICPEDAIVAIYRAPQVVVAGDRNQLPPTPFFQVFASMDEEAEIEEAFDEYESVLDALSGKGLAELDLRWHYRSQREDLIAFSNHQFYDDKLVTFPNADGQNRGVHFDYVPGGVYDRGGNRTNHVEAQRVVEVALTHIEQYPAESLGIVAFSISQADAIENVLEKRLGPAPEIQARFRRDRLEGFFVKNLENVQGDERDVMIFSVGYGRDPLGRLTMNFGPLNKSGGQRRLNVAVTRARRQVIIVSSIRAHDIAVTEATPSGVKALKAYLDYAEHGPKTLLAGMAVSQGESESLFEREVEGAIRNMGYQTVPQVGCSGYRIDIGVLDPDTPGRFILGVECDGASYHSAATARDRDRLRQEVLERLGWRIHRVWSTDWVTRPRTEVTRLAESLREALKWRSQTAPVLPSPTSAELPQVLLVDAPSTLACHSRAGLTDWQTPYEVFAIEAWTQDAIAKLIEVEGPVHKDVVLGRLARLLDRKLGSTIKSILDQMVHEATRLPCVRLQDGFLYNTTRPITRARIPTNEPDSLRAPKHICLEEYRIAVSSILRSAGAMDEDSLVRAILGVFGIRRSGSRVREVVIQVLHRIETSGSIQQRDGRWTLV